jgi:hypothetical protein
MMPAFTRKVQVQIDAEEKLILELTYDYHEKANDELAVKVSRGASHITVKWAIDLEHATFSLIEPGTLKKLPKEAHDIAEALGVTVGKAVLGCIWEHRNTPAGIVECMKGKATGALLDSALLLQNAWKK